MTPALVRRLHAEGFVARAWGVTSEALMQQVVEAGADGMTVNFPDQLIAYLKSHHTGGSERGAVGQRGHDVPFTTQTRLHFDVILPLWGRRGPR